LRRPASLLAVTLVTLLWSAALFAAPSAETPHFSALVYAAGSMVCHQRPERSFHRNGVQYPVCARCLGLYAGAVGGVAAWVVASGLSGSPKRRVARFTAAHWKRLITFVAAPTVLSVLTGLVGWWDASNAVRAALALPFGASVSAVIAAAAAGDLR
jgi:uncharacterized membrane protein